MKHISNENQESLSSKKKQKKNNVLIEKLKIYPFS